MELGSPEAETKLSRRTSALNFSPPKQMSSPAASAPQIKGSEETKISGGLGRVFRAVRHVRQNRERVRCELLIERLQLRVPSPKKVNLEWIRGPKRVCSLESHTLHKNVWTCQWTTPLILMATLFWTCNSDGGRRYATKETCIRFLDPSVPRHKEAKLGEIVFDLAEAAQSKNNVLRATVPLAKSLDPNARVSLKLTLSPMLETEVTGASSLSSEGEESTRRTSSGPTVVTPDPSRTLSRRRSIHNSRHVLRPKGDGSPLYSDTEDLTNRSKKPATIGTAGRVVTSVSQRSVSDINLEATANRRSEALPGKSASEVGLASATQLDTSKLVQESSLKLGRKLTTNLSASPSLASPLPSCRVEVREYQEMQELIAKKDTQISGLMDQLTAMHSALERVQKMQNSTFNTPLSYSRQDLNERSARSGQYSSASRAGVTKNSLLDRGDKTSEEGAVSHRNRTSSLRMERPASAWRFHRTDVPLQTRQETVVDHPSSPEKHKMCNRILTMGPSSDNQRQELFDRVRQLEHELNVEKQSAALERKQATGLISSLRAQLLAASSDAANSPETSAVGPKMKPQPAESPELSRLQTQVTELEEELVNVKVRLAQVETEKDQVVEKARKRIEALKGTCREYALTVDSLEREIAQLKMGIKKSAASKFPLKPHHTRS
eukprot:Gregarina_sp_Poly_1__28@NODE_1006_length_5387_cov_109_543233_g27_i1_p1_GENE_NODE_1006_length_5387_cov_109_543233_g27_i1NODE_1006_length_5387_cov_109_543233_g27_i1_p1_ORF_typecomplete_len665_score101_67NTC2/PF10358_9/4_5e05HAP1_N/PF04849_13/1_4e02HAP1_N/PF04849_13/0_00064KASH_CCD/PF14662_6/74KASH_CCD/PF14662_6/0_087COG2/PF06148_11/15COG2/PF06148_11/2_1GIT_CC/PF16559_5/1_9GIT_CC/PF16559_5/31AAA_13/PF13166_6/2_7e02AAA_13/PF13166_6/0_051AAA_23/PF13476_6/0_77Baculo_F/PF12259_8/4_5Baculo_F/PF12259_8/8